MPRMLPNNVSRRPHPYFHITCRFLGSAHQLRIRLAPFSSHSTPPLFTCSCCITSCADLYCSTVFSHASTVVQCGNCAQVLCQPSGGKAKLTEGELEISHLPLFFALHLHLSVSLRTTADDTPQARHSEERTRAHMTDDKNIGALAFGLMSTFRLFRIGSIHYLDDTASFIYLYYIFISLRPSVTL